MKIRVRIAPSPTGNLHIGTARTALFNWLFAKKNGGEFILRIEDTDLERSDKKYEESIIKSLKWLGLDWDSPSHPPSSKTSEGHSKATEEQGGGLYRQSGRLDIYEKYIRQLIDSDKAFWCHHTKEELENEQKEQAERKEAPRHICEHKKTELGKQKGQIIRLAVDENSTRSIRFDDEVRGTIKWQEHLLGDFSLAKDFRIPLYNFAVVVDDIDMEISHVIRGEDHISNTPKQILIYEALGVKSPIFAHLPLILGPNRTKLSKRHGATSVSEYRKDYLPEALVNFMGFLGYTYSKEIINKEKMAEEFELKKVHKSAAVFNIDKLNWINSQYIKQLSPQEFKRLVGKQELSDGAIRMITERMEKLSEIENFKYLWEEPEYPGDMLRWKLNDTQTTISSLRETAMIVRVFGTENKSLLRSKEEKLSMDKFNGDRGVVFWPLRVSATGKEKSPDPIEIVHELGKEETLKRIENAINKL